MIWALCAAQTTPSDRLDKEDSRWLKMAEVTPRKELEVVYATHHAKREPYLDGEGIKYQFLIVNSKGKINCWVHGVDIFEKWGG